MTKLTTYQAEQLDESLGFLKQIEFRAEATMAQVFLQIESLKDAGNEWFLDFDTADVYSCDRQELIEVLAGVPSGYLLLQGYLAGILMMRTEMQNVSGRPFQ